MKKIILLASALCIISSAQAQEININYDVPLIPQIDKTSCWAASSAMILSSVTQSSVSVQSIKDKVNTSLPAVDITNGLFPDDTKAVGDLLGLTFDYPQCYGVAGFADLLKRAKGPVAFVVENGDGGVHAIIINGMKGDGTPEGTNVEYLDPWPPNKGEINSENFSTLMASMEKLGFMDQSIWANPDGSANGRLYVLFQKN
ncbi:hypothetical protein BH11BAC1_BH11BAC1_26360 [soil metagenome]